MRKLLKLVFRYFITFLILILFVMSLLFIILPPDYNEYEYENSNAFLSSEQSSWYINDILEKGQNIYLRTYYETNDLIILFQISKNDEVLLSRLIPVKSKIDSKKFFKQLNISSKKTKNFINKGQEYCFISSDGKYYLISKYYENDKVNYILTNLLNSHRLEFCQ